MSSSVNLLDSGSAGAQSMTNLAADKSSGAKSGRSHVPAKDLIRRPKPPIPDDESSPGNQGDDDAMKGNDEEEEDDDDRDAGGNGDDPQDEEDDAVQDLLDDSGGAGTADPSPDAEEDDVVVDDVQVLAILSNVIGDRNAACAIKHQEVADRAHLGYFGFPLQNPPEGITMGKYNDRPLNPVQYKRISNGFETQGILSAQPDRAIHLAVRKSWYVGKPARTCSGKNVLGLPRFVLTEEGKEAARKGLINPLSGNHRQAALRDASERTAKKIEAIKGEIKRQTPKSGEAVSKATAHSLREKNGLIEELEERMSIMELWGCKIYDLGEYAYDYRKMSC